jgi:leucyl-tRNA synthetase
MAQTIALAQTGKRDHLVSLEKQYQARWEAERVFEVDPPPVEETRGLSPAEIQQKFPKWMGTFPFPYMNGSLHLGHAFTISKIEFAAGYQRMLGKRALFPHGFHVTGMPIKAAADKIIREMQLFGDEFERFEADDKAAAPPPPTAGDAPASNAPEDKSKAKKGKIAAKATGHTYQFQIMESIGVPRADIKKFADPLHWLTYFPPIAIADNKALGTRVDWRRTFMTTPANPYYDSFVRWQMNKLYSLQKVKFGERYTIYSPKDGQPCMDHDRQDGEGVGPQEYTGIKMEVINWSERLKQADLTAKAGGRKVFLVAATLRPETMYGQTNCFVGPTIKYGLFAVNEKDAFVCTHRAARNMAFQGTFTPPGQVIQLAEINGEDIVGSKVKAAFGIVPEVYVLPMETVLETKGTGVVTSVPSDSPDDYATLLELRKKAAYYKIEPEWAAIDPIPVLSTPTYGELTAPALYKSLKVQSPKDAKALGEAKDVAYKEGFYNGTMLVGEYKGQSVQDAKPKVRASMIEAGLAIAYAEPDGLVISRSADECIVALMDQWYMDYGELSWREEAEKHLASMELYSTETRNAFQATLAWLNQWACARTYGLGSKLPWDPQFLVESLSDSTIYMAYYAVARLLHENDITGSKPGPLGIRAEELTDEVWNYIFGSDPYPMTSSIPQDKLDALKYEFQYFYPMDVRSSGKDLINNHLTFCLYNHVALFPPEQRPLSFRTNGHLMLNGKKMSKSTGNSLTLKEAVNKFGADATRLSLADAGDGVEDANFDEMTANANILRVHTLLAWCEETLNNLDGLRQGPKDSPHDQVFAEEVNELINITQSHYEATNYKDALKYGFYELQSARDWYREVTADIGMHRDLVQYWIRVSALLVAPIAPHFSEHIYSSLLKESQSIQLALWPTPTQPVNRTTIETGAYMRTTTKLIRDAEATLVKKLSKVKGKGGANTVLYDPKRPKSVRIYVSSSFPQWQDSCVQIVQECYDETTEKVDDAKVRQLLNERGLGKDKHCMPFIQALKKRISQFGAQLAFRRTLPFSEVTVLTALRPYLLKNLGVVEAEILTVEDARSKVGQPGFTANIIESSEPGSPSCEYFNV